jgi:DNA-binding beta-propeller fold protein YncE
MAFLVFAFLPDQRDLADGVKSLVKPKTAFFLCWFLFFVMSHLWNFRTAPWNGNGLFEDSAIDLLYLKSYVMGHPFQPAWFHPYPYLISRETLFHYYLWAFLDLFGYNIISYEAALLVLWSGVFIFTLLLVDLFFGSYVVISLTALVFNFLPFAFIYTFVGYRYPLTVLLCVASLYFLHLGFRTSSSLALSLSGIAAGLCLASSTVGKQYVLALMLWAICYAGFRWRGLKQINWSSAATVVYGFLVAATPILCYIIFNWGHYTYYEGTFVNRFLSAARGHPIPDDMRYYVTGLWSCFFRVPGPRLFIPEFLPVPLAYYFFLLPGLIVALWQRRYEVVLLATLPVVSVFTSGGPVVEHRLLLAIPFWIILMGFAIAGLLKLRLPAGFKIIVLGVAACALACGFALSVQYIHSTTKTPFSMMSQFSQQKVAVSRFLRNVVTGKEPLDAPRLEYNEFNRVQGVPDPPYETLICARDANVVLHLFLHDYDDTKVLSFCGGSPMSVMTSEEVWSGNKKAILDYVPHGKDLKLIWETDPKTETIIAKFRSLSDLATADSMSFSFDGTKMTFKVLNIASKNIQRFQQGVNALPGTAQLSPLPTGLTDMFQGGHGTGRGQFDSPTGIAVDGSRNVFVADTANGRIEKFSANGTFVTSIGPFEAPNGIAIDRAGNIYVAEIGSKHRVQKLGPDGTLIAEWKGAEPGFYGPRRIAIGPDDSIYVVDQGHARIVRFNLDGEVLATWGSGGTSDGQFRDPTSVAVDPANKVYVADPINRRIQVFDSDGRFLTKWPIPEWGRPHGYEDLTIDSKAGRLYASSANIDAVFIFDLNGSRLGSLTPKPPDKLDGPSALALANRKLYVLNMAGNRVTQIDL